MIAATTLRRLLIAPALIAVCGLVVALAAGVPWFAPWSPREQIKLQGAAFQPVMGVGVEDGEALGIGAIGPDGNALQTAPLDRLRAADLPILRYRFEQFPRTLELSLVFRRADAPGDVQAISLPWPGNGTTSVDLAALPAWHGEITEIGFAEYATAQLVPPSIAFKPFRLVKAQLQSRSWHSAPGLLRTAWLGYRPWALLSISAVGQAIESVGAAPIVPAIAFGVLLAIVCTASLLGWRAATRVRCAVVFFVLAWLLLDARWLDDLAAKHRLSENVYAGKSWVERERLQPDEETVAMAQIVRAKIGGQTPAPRVLVTSDSTYTLLRLIYFLLPLDAAPLDPALLSGTALPRDSVIVTYASTWHYDAERGTLGNGTLSIGVDAVFATQDLCIYRVRGAGS